MISCSQKRNRTKRPSVPRLKSVISSERVRKRNLGDVVGTRQEDPDFDEAVADQDKVDEEMWR